jgi:protease II
MLCCRRGSDLGAALLRAPFVDLVSTALNPDAPLVAHEASEWGDAGGDASALDVVSHRRSLPLLLSTRTLLLQCSTTR